MWTKIIVTMTRERRRRVRGVLSLRNSPPQPQPHLPRRRVDITQKTPPRACTSTTRTCSNIQHQACGGHSPNGDASPTPLYAHKRLARAARKQMTSHISAQRDTARAGYDVS